MLTYSEARLDWCPFPEEIYGKNFRADEDGLLISSGVNKMFIDEDEITAKFNDENIFFINKEYGYLNILLTKRIEIIDKEDTPSLARAINKTEYIIEQKNGIFLLY